MKLTYFDGRGRAEPIRLMLAAGGIDYQDVRITFEEWPKMKDDTPLGHLPILGLDDGTVLAESNAIGRYVAKLSGLYGKAGDDVEQAKIDMVFGFITDFVQAVVKVAYESNEEIKKKSAQNVIAKTMPDFVSRAEKILKDNGGEYLVGNKLSWADVFMFDTLNSLTDPTDPFYGPYLKNVLGDSRLTAIDQAPLLQKLLATVKANPGISAWLEKRPKNSEQIF